LKIENSLLSLLATPRRVAIENWCLKIINIICCLNFSQSYYSQSLYLTASRASRVLFWQARLLRAEIAPQPQIALVQMNAFVLLAGHAGHQWVMLLSARQQNGVALTRLRKA